MCDLCVNDDLKYCLRRKLYDFEKEPQSAEKIVNSKRNKGNVKFQKASLYGQCGQTAGGQYVQAFLAKLNVMTDMRRA